MHPDEATLSEAPQSLTAAEALHKLVARLEQKLSPVLRPASPSKEASTSGESKSELMHQLGYIQNHVQDIIDRLHI